ncbi:hypothetical protein [Mucilaginibacter segetis]|uniref:Uncharacterized protein n=1 Tax=Mucilaginibacter segetis TaxID=2793071 RepID=A0A934PTH5_9SPHI|nr:hypothetical protein [Mucilaginibacter segetis]MBK0379306.1 hypothetical protein [Mucilaginibacter segetis]
MTLEEFEQDWESKSANISADLAYTKNLNEHFVTTQLAIHRLHDLMLLTSDKAELQHFMLLGYEIYALNYQILAHIPDFAAKQRQQLMALSKGTIKEEKLYNVTLNPQQATAEQDFLASLKERDFLIQDALITPDRNLVILLINPQPETLHATATAYHREIDAKGLTFRKILFYDVATATIAPGVYGVPLFEKPLNY